jgi:hypothetical protein
MVMFVTLRQYGYGKSCSSHCENMVMFVTFRDSMLCLSNKETQCYIHHIARFKDIFVTFHKYGYVCHIATTKLCSSHCDNMTIFITLRQRGNVCVVFDDVSLHLLPQLSLRDRMVNVEGLAGIGVNGVVFFVPNLLERPVVVKNLSRVFR